MIRSVGGSVTRSGAARYITGATTTLTRMGRASHQQIILIFLLSLCSGCGYTVLKNPDPTVRETQEEAMSSSEEIARRSDSLLFGDWVGSGRCSDHGAQYDDEFQVTFSSDYSCVIQSSSSTFRGHWSSSLVQDRYRVIVTAGDSAWGWSGPWDVRIHENSMALSFTRPLQFDCTLSLVRATPEQ
jgi:hypothetical protein